MSPRKSDEDVRLQFRSSVNMTAGELEKWLDRPESKAAGQHGDVSETTWRFSLMNRGHDPIK